MREDFDSNEGEAFYADSIGIIFKQDQFVFDFAKSVPRVERNQKRKRIVTEHNPIIANPKKAKVFKKLLEKNIEKYEEKFGEIEIEQQEQKEEEEEDEPVKHDYIG